MIRILLTLGTVLLADQLSKLVVAMLMSPGESIPVLGNFFQLTYTRNPKGAFGISLGGSSLQIVISVVVIAFLIGLLWETGKEGGKVPIALACILAGAIGNLIDRVRWGEVIDFINLGIGKYRWPVFNLADLAVTAGAVFLIFSFLKREKPLTEK